MVGELDDGGAVAIDPIADDTLQKQENWFPVGKVGAKIIYADQKSCELAEGQKCFEITGKDLRFWIDSGKGDLVVDKQLQADAEAQDALKLKEAEDLIVEKETLLAELKASGDQNILKLLKLLDL